MTTMTLQEAIKEIKRTTPTHSPWVVNDFEFGDYWEANDTDRAIAIILNAVVKGELK